MQLKANFNKYDINEVQSALGDIGSKVRSLSTKTDEFKIVSQGWDSFMTNLEAINFMD